MTTSDVIIVGGGVIGLATALELAEQGCTVTVVDRQAVGRESSWAGAGMIPPGEIHLASPGYRQLAIASSALWPEFSARVHELTGIDDEYHNCGAVILPPADDPAAIGDEIADWHTQQIETQLLEGDQLRQTSSRFFKGLDRAYLLPGQAQVRNPRHLKALIAGCRKLGVQIREDESIERMTVQGNRLVSVSSEHEEFSGDRFLITAGAWSGFFGELLNVTLPVAPVRGQLVMVQLPEPFPFIVEQGKRYLVPRLDGRLLIGSTESLVGFDRTVEPDTIEVLQEFAASILPEVERLPVERSWCGFRPAATDRLPVLGQAPGIENVIIGTGHYRAGLSLCPVTARILSDLALGRDVEFDLHDFRPERFAEPVAEHV
ncbi:glycine oxidase ThiO [Rubinisphaera margarita]|uniref:glycine oxidase ThiO n=1 Tax=Rubinisphaera margarita TaxID=2909586 RepID=UPI001EE80C09|nr:glycine oxidase ThiO [Rubinisphaera margarita]MCG6154219.1 glycine oxidase ThiO [Rubinisphaera margarita]